VKPQNVQVYYDTAASVLLNAEANEERSLALMMMWVVSDDIAEFRAAIQDTFSGIDEAELQQVSDLAQQGEIFTAARKLA
jgi:hypothetical protein